MPPLAERVSVCELSAAAPRRQTCGAVVFLPGDQPPIGQPLPYHTMRQHGHLRNGVEVSHVVPAGELPNVAVRMFRASVVIGTVVAAFHDGPESLHPVRVASPRTYPLAL